MSFRDSECLSILAIFSGENKSIDQSVATERNAKGRREIAANSKLYTPHTAFFERGAKLKMLLSIDRGRFVAPDFERDERNAPDLRALNWLSVANRRSSLQTSFSPFFIYHSPLI